MNEKPCWENRTFIPSNFLMDKVNRPKFFQMKKGQTNEN